MLSRIRRSFFETYITLSINDKIKYNKVVESIDYSGSNVIARTKSEEFIGVKIIVTAPVKTLQNGAISFAPELPASKRNTIAKVKVWDGFKAFIEFSEKFYPEAIGYKITPAYAGQRMYLRCRLRTELEA